MKKLLAGLLAAAVLLTGCGGSGDSQSTRLGSYDGGHRLTLSTQDASPGTIRDACNDRLTKYKRQLALYLKAQDMPVNKPYSAEVNQFDLVSTPSFEMHVRDLDQGQYLSACKSALTGKLNG